MDQAQDRWVYWPIVVSTAVFAGLTLLCGLPGEISFTMIPISFLIYIVALIVVVWLAIRFAASKRPRRSMSALSVLVVPMVLSGPVSWAADCIHMGLTAGFGAGQLRATSKSGGAEFAAYDWSTGLAGGPVTFLIHDVTGEIALPLTLHKQPLVSENGFGEECAGRVRHLPAHYYVCRFQPG
jgi:uncharacterized membrane protein